AYEGRPEDEVAAYLIRWALLSEAEVAAAMGALRAPIMEVYTLGYYIGWKLLKAWLNVPDRPARVRRLLTEQLLPADVSTTT
ncbi:hypothetical protein ACFQ07_05410, partial [Actinomadura adrarensis]